MTRRGHKSFARERQLVAFAGRLAAHLRPPLVIWLRGELGSGKTTFARALIRALGYDGRVKSPTYGLLEHYPLEHMQVLHLDLYRIGDADELEFLGLADLFDENTIVLVEWPEKSGRWLPEPDFVFDFSYTDSGRGLAWCAQSPAARKIRFEDL